MTAPAGYTGRRRLWKAVSNHNLTATDTAAATSVAFAAGVQCARIAPKIDIWYAIGAAPTAATTTQFLAAGAVEYVPVSEGDKVSVLRVGDTSGAVSIQGCVLA